MQGVVLGVIQQYRQHAAVGAVQPRLYVKVLPDVQRQQAVVVIRACLCVQGFGGTLMKGQHCTQS